MVVFLYTGFIVASVFMFFLFHKQSKKVKKIKDNPKNISKMLLKFALIDLVMGIFIMAFISYLIPLTIWLVGEKAVMPTEMITMEKTLAPLSKDIYMKVEETDGGEPYTINLGTIDNVDEKVISKSRVSIEEVKKPSMAQYREAFVYDFKRLKRENFITKQVNDIFANINLQSKDGTFIEKKVTIALPRGYKTEKK